MTLGARMRGVVAIALLSAAVPRAMQGQSEWTPRQCLADTLRAPVAATTVDTVAPGLVYRCLVDPRGPWVVHVVEVDLHAQGLIVDAARALGAFFGRERVSAMAARLAAAGRAPLVGINADFFDLRSGEVENNHVIGGAWVKGALSTDSPHDGFDNAHTQFAIDARGGPRIGRFELDGTVVSASAARRLVGINYRPAGRAGLVVYTPWYGVRTPQDTSARIGGEGPRDPDATPAGMRVDTVRPPSTAATRSDSAHRLAAQATRHAAEIVLTRLGQRGDTILYRVTSRVPTMGGGTAIPAHGAVLSATGDEALAFVREVAARRSTVKLVAGISGFRRTPRAIVGGWPRVVDAGRNVGVVADSVEGTFPRFSEARHPRSALGISRDGRTLYMVVVDGRRPWSVGMSLGELGAELITLGAWDAMNLDGGGSSALWIRGHVVNYPSDPGGERAVGNALFVSPATR
ncbi:MAG: phosphodiester glycosidase family protein [Gemmatimonadaceae bacterium]|nr:phosphodiester glycosidase family protein [Gemmatimonadaceae bacterium]